MKAQVKEQLSLSKKEWNGILVLLALILLVLAAPYVYQWFHKDSTLNLKAFNDALAQLDRADRNKPDQADNPLSLTKHLFKFNPNNLPAEKWRQLGLNDKQINVINNYQSKGGRFYTPEDVKKIYGISASDYSRLAPYIDLPAERHAKTAVVELNTADSAKLVAIDGIGGAFARRIIYYRERLGGFIKKEQLKEVAGLDELKYDEIKDQVRVDPSRIRKIEINNISFDKLRLMPYLNYKQVNAVIEYRNQHGDYGGLEDLKNIPIIDDEIIRKIAPYLSFK